MSEDANSTKRFGEGARSSQIGRGVEDDDETEGEGEEEEEESAGEGVEDGGGRKIDSDGIDCIIDGSLALKYGISKSLLVELVSSVFVSVVTGVVGMVYILRHPPCSGFVHWLR